MHIDLTSNLELFCIIPTVYFEMLSRMLISNMLQNLELSVYLGKHNNKLISKDRTLQYEVIFPYYDPLFCSRYYA